MDYIPHLALPIQLIGNSYSTRQQDTDAEAADCVKIILSFEKGQRFADLDFGIDDPTFETQPIDIDGIAKAIADYEPRVDAEINTVDLPNGSTTVSVLVTIPTSDDLPQEA